MATSDEQLVAVFQASQSPAAFDELIERHLPMVRNLAYRLVLCNATADDVAQEVFMKVCRQSGSFRGDAKFSTWLYRITANTAKEHLRRQRETVDLREAEERLASPDHERPDQLAMGGELATRVDHAMAQLSVKLRTAIVLTSIERLTAKQAAAIEGCSTATMYWRVHQARKRLKQLLQEYFKS